MDLATAWPAFGLRLRHRDLELRPTTDDDALLIASWIPDLLHAEQRHLMPYLFRAIDADTPEEMARLELQWIWRQRATMSPDDWGLSVTARAKYVQGLRRIIGLHRAPPDVPVRVARRVGGVAVRRGRT